VVLEPGSARGADAGALAIDAEANGAARVLLVETDSRSATLVAELLRAVWGRGLVLVHTLTVPDAARELLDHGADCVLLHPPGNRPVADAVAQLATAAPDAPIIVLGTGGEEDLPAMQAGAQDVLGLGELSPTRLRRAIRHAVVRKRAEVALARQALQDPLTLLPNRSLFIDRLHGALDRARRTATPVVVLFLDVDTFKAVNDSLGHAAGDRLLQLLAQRFSGLMRPMDTVARFGGDEFTFLFEGLSGIGEAAEVAERIRHAAAEPVALGEREMMVTVSIGVAVVADPTISTEEIIRRADGAMYQAKARGGGVQLAGEWLGADPAGLERDLGHAVERSQLRVHYQPRVSLDGETGLVGFEALVRWAHPEHGLMQPSQFIALAERSGLIAPIGDWVVDQALRQVQTWRRARPGVTISVNLSARQLTDPDLPVRLARTIREGGHDPSALCLEVPEEALQTDPELACRRLAALNELGITLAVDDFGTAGASATALERMPIHILKIDRTLVSELGPGDPSPGQDEAREIRAAVRLGHELGLSVVAEGVETDEQLAQIRAMGCDGAQGFLFSEPLPEERVLAALGG
jgi:diguanylate cyclase (GGDEF)-like protein